VAALRTELEQAQRSSSAAQTPAVARSSAPANAMPARAPSETVTAARAEAERKKVRRAALVNAKSGRSRGESKKGIKVVLAHEVGQPEGPPDGAAQDAKPAKPDLLSTLEPQMAKKVRMLKRLGGGGKSDEELLAIAKAAKEPAGGSAKKRWWGGK
jgi:hypothetical protein